MVNTSNTDKPSFIKLKFDGFDPKVQLKNDFEKKIKEIKEKISASIKKNVNYENHKSDLPKSMRILEDTDTHTIINLRCGSKKLFQNTTKLGDYTHIQILESLKGMLDAGELDKFIEAYANGRPLIEKVATKKKAKSKAKSKAKVKQKSKKEAE